MRTSRCRTTRVDRPARLDSEQARREAGLLCLGVVPFARATARDNGLRASRSVGSTTSTFVFPACPGGRAVDGGGSRRTPGERTVYTALLSGAVAAESQCDGHA